MAYKRTESPDGSWVEEYSGSELDAFMNLPPAAECSACHRKSWDTGMIGRTCYMAQPNGGTCAGVFRALNAR